MSSRRITRKKLVFVALTAAVILVAIAAYLIVHNHKTRETIHVASSGNQSTRAVSTAPKSTDKQIATSSGNVTPPSAAKSSSTTSTLLVPSGPFVSNHHPSLGGSVSPSGEQSVCNTTPGATCYVEFIKGSVIKQLPSATADSSGAAYWTWDVNKAGLTTGQWQIQAVANLNGQTKTAQDSLALDVQP